MNAAPSINSPCCRRPLVLSPDEAACEACGVRYELVEFPALRAERAVQLARPLDADTDATCFFHARNQAAAICQACGRFLCPVCAVNHGGGVLCPACIASQKGAGGRAENSRWNPDSVALLLATAPVVFWPFTLFTAPAVLAVIVINWKKRMPVPARRVRWQRWLAGILALPQVAGWAFLFARIFSS